MRKLRCIAIDDEPFALEILVDDISKVPFLELVGQFSSPLDAWEALQHDPYEPDRLTGGASRRNLSVDLLFLDIQMPTLTGVQFLRTLTRPPMVILTTAYEQYALEGYDLNVVDYLLKPIPFARFLRAVNKAYDLFQLQQPPAASSALLDSEQSASPSALTGEPDCFFIFSEYREIKILYREVLYVEGLKDYVKIYTTQQTKHYLSRLALKAIEARLPKTLFCRVHKSFIVSLAKISSFQRTKLFIGNQEIPVGSTYGEEFERRYRAT